MGELYSTPDRVRRRLGYSDPTLSDTALWEYITDASAYIEISTQTIFLTGDYRYALAQSVCTDLASIYAVIRPAGGIAEGLDYKIDEFQVKKSTQLESRLRTASQFRISAREGLAALKTDDNSVPVSTTQAYG